MIASHGITKAQPISYPTAVAMAALMTKSEQRYETLVEEFAQRCYFYTYNQALEKTKYLFNIEKSQLNQKQLDHLKTSHETNTKQSRTQLFNESWTNGFQALDDLIQKRKLARTRRKQLDFHKNFIM